MVNAGVDLAFGLRVLGIDILTKLLHVDDTGILSGLQEGRSLSVDAKN